MALFNWTLLKVELKLSNLLDNWLIDKARFWKPCQFLIDWIFVYLYIIFGRKNAGQYSLCNKGNKTGNNPLQYQLLHIIKLLLDFCH